MFKRNLRKGLAILATSATVLWSVGVFLLVPVVAQAAAGRVGVLFALSHQVERLMCAIAHPPTDNAAQRIARGGHQNGRPEQIGVEFDQPKNGRLGA